jgi:VanZ family protein
MLRRYLQSLFALELLAATWLSLVPVTVVPATLQFWDKAQHGLMFLVLSSTGCWAYRGRWRSVGIGLLLYGGLIEVLQATLTATRYGDLQDWLADGMGISLGVFIFKGTNWLVSQSSLSSTHRS